MQFGKSSLRTDKPKYNDETKERFSNFLSQKESVRGCYAKSLFIDRGIVVVSPYLINTV